MARLNFSDKRLQIDKANARIVVIISLAAMVTTFSLVSCKALLSQQAYQARVIAEKEKAVLQLEENVRAVESLNNSYAEFIGTAENIIGGDPNGGGDRDGDNAKIILDALPSKYDFPALASSLEKLLVERNFKVESLTGTDDELAQVSQTSTPNPVPLEIPFQITVTSDYASLQTLIKVFEQSIRPIHLTSLTFSGDDSATQLIVNAKTYYQPARNLDIRTKDVR